MGANRENGSDESKNGKGKDKKNVQRLKAKNVEETLKRIEEVEPAAESSEDSPFVSGSEEDTDDGVGFDV